MVKINEGWDDFSGVRTGLEAVTELSATALFVEGTYLAARAAKRAAQNGHPLKALGWAGLGLMGAMTSGILALDAFESVETNMQRNRTANSMNQPATPAES